MTQLFLKVSRKPITLAALIIFAVAMLVQGQQAASATLTGTIKDPNGALVSGARVSATHRDTGTTREVSTNENGDFVITNLATGVYDIKVSATGFEERTVSQIRLQVGQASNLDISLAIGIKEVVLADDFGAGYELVNTRNGVVDGVIRDLEVQNMPLNGRNFLELALLVPGNTPAPNFDPTKTNTLVISSAGQLGRGGNVTIDGADNNDDVVGGPVQNISQDAVGEFQIATNRFSAELGRSGSAVINVVTKSGTNEFHGLASGFFRDSALQGLPATFDRTLQDEPPFDRQQYSFALGGPIKRDKAWFFSSFEYRNQDGAVLVGTRDLATQSIRKGFATAPLNDLLNTNRVDFSFGDKDQLSVRYSLQRENDVAASSLIRAIGSASERQASENNTHSVVGRWSHIISPTTLNTFSFSYSHFFNDIEPVTPGPQLTFPSIQDGASFRVPQGTKQRRVQLTDSLSYVHGNHTFNFGGELQFVRGDFDLRVFQQGRIELIEDFPDFDRNGDGRVDDNDLVFAVTLRSNHPSQPLLIPDASNIYFAGYVQDDWRVTPQLTLNLGLRYEIDSDVKNISRVDELNPLILPFLHGTRGKDKNNFGPRVGFNYSSSDGRMSVHGGYGIYYDRITLEIQSLERGLDGRALPIDVRAGNLFFLDPQFLFDPVKGVFPPGAPTLANPFTGFILPGAGAGGINIIDNGMQNPMVQQWNLGIQKQFGDDFVVRADYLHNFGTHFIIGRTIGQVFNPVVGGPDTVKNLESSVKTKYDGLLVSLEKRFANHYQFRTSYTLSKTFNYANDDQIPFSNGPINPNNLQLEYGPTPNDQRHRFTFSGLFELPYGIKLAPLVTIASGVPMDILVPDGSQRIPQLQRNAGNRLFKSASELNSFITNINAAGGFAGQPLPLVTDGARFSDTFNSFDFRVSKTFKIGESMVIEPIAEVFNVFNVTNVLGVSNANYSGFNNVLVRDSNDPTQAGFLRSSSFGQPVTTAGGVFGSGGPRAFQLGARFTF